MGRFECDTSIAYRSVIVFGTIRIVDAEEDKARFFVELMRSMPTPPGSVRRGSSPASTRSRSTRSRSSA